VAEGAEPGESADVQVGEAEHRQTGGRRAEEAAAADGAAAGHRAAVGGHLMAVAAEAAGILRAVGSMTCTTDRSEEAF